MKKQIVLGLIFVLSASLAWAKSSEVFKAPYEQTFNVVIKVLDDMGYTIAVENREKGVILTEYNYKRERGLPRGSEWRRKLKIKVKSSKKGTKVKIVKCQFAGMLTDELFFLPELKELKEEAKKRHITGHWFELDRDAKNRLKSKFFRRLDAELKE